MIFNLKIDEFDDEKKFKVEDNFFLIHKDKEIPLFIKFLEKYKDEVDFLLIFAMYFLANTQNLEEKYEEIKSLIKTEEGINNLKCFFEDRETENIKKFLNNEERDFIYSFAKIENDSQNSNFSLFSLDIIKFSDEVEINEKNFFDFLKEEKKENSLEFLDVLNVEFEIEE